MIKPLLLIALLTVAFSSSSLADNEQMKATLVKISNQLEAIKPLIDEAQQEQSSNPQVKVHFNTWVDANGVSHSGLKQDVEAMQSALIEAINRTSVDPRTITPINNDFINSKGD